MTDRELLEAALEQQEQEPVAWGQLGLLNGKTYLRMNYDRTPYPPPAGVVRNLNLVPLYAAPLSALEQPEQEPVAWMYQGIKHDGTTHGPHLVWKPEHMDAMSAEKGVKAVPLYAALKGGRQSDPSPEQPEQEPVAWRYEAQERWLYVDKNPNLWLEKPDGEIQPLYVQQTTDCLSDEKNAAIFTVDTGSMSN